METETEFPKEYAELFDSNLLDLTLAGHQQAFRALIARHRERLYCTTLAMLDSHSAAEQALKDATDHAYKNLHRYKASESMVFSWLCKQVIEYVFRHYTMPSKDQPAKLRKEPLPEDCLNHR